MMTRNLLIVASYFSPSAIIGAQRSVKLTLKIGEHGWRPDVLTVSKNCCERIDSSAPMDRLRAAAAITRVPCRSIWRHSKWWRQSKPGLPRILAKARRALAKYTGWISPTDDWWPWNVLATSAGVRIVRDRKIDLIWASSPPVGGLDLARRISEKTGVPYVVDVRDVSITQDTRDLPGWARKRLECERRAIALASGVTYTAPHQIELLDQLHPGAGDLPHRLIYNWFDCADSDACPIRNFEHPTILHGGSLYGGQRRISGFMDALANLLQKPVVADKGLNFVNHGPTDDDEYLRDETNRCGLSESVKLAGPISSRDFHSCCRGAAILLLVVGKSTATAEHTRAVPGKLFDYFAAGRPILVIGPKGCEAGNMVTRINRGLAVPDDDPVSIREAIAKLLQERGVSGRLDLSHEAVSEFESAQAVRNIADFLRSVCPPPASIGDGETETIVEPDGAFPQ